MAQLEKASIGGRHDWHDKKEGKWYAGCITTAHVLARVEPDGEVTPAGIEVQITDASNFRGDVIRIAQPNSNLGPAELRAMAAKSMSRLPGDAITLELLESSEGGEETHALAEPCKVGECDFFLSHSWHDDPVAKYAAIQQAIVRFRKQHGRTPSFWLDKACIDQAGGALS